MAWQDKPGILVIWDDDIGISNRSCDDAIKATHGAAGVG